MFESVLVPIDGSRPSIEAVLYSEAFSKAFGSRLVLLYVVSPEMKERAKQEMAGPREMANEVLEIARRALRRKGLSVKTLVLEGAVAQRICSAVLSEKCDLVIMGSRSLAEIPEFLTDSISEKVSQFARSPVLVVRNLHPLRSILIAYDGSRSARRALEIVGELALRLKTKVHLLEINADEWAALPEPRAGGPILDWHLGLSQKGIEVEMDLRQGYPADKIVRLVQEKEVGLVVMGRTGGGTGEEGLGSLSDQVLRRCPSAVLLVK